MAGFKLFTSNRLELLVEDLAEIMRQPLASPLQPEVIVVQSLGMARWLSLELTERNKICANCRFPFPNAFAYEAFKAVLPDLPVETDCRQEVLVWKAMQALTKLDGKTFPEIENYIGDGRDSRKLFQLASKVAWLFDQYLIFRPDFIKLWAAGEEEHWQAALWRFISPDLKSTAPPQIKEAFQQKILHEDAELTRLPERISIFGISALPPFHMEIFQALAARIDVNFFLLQPCREFWGDISSDREINRTLQRAGKSAAESAELHLERGNRLLASMGKLGRDFLKLLYEDDNLTPIDQFEDPGEKRLLNIVQSDILNLRDRSADGTEVITLPESDESIQIHSCHSPMREMEALYDCMLDWFQHDSTLAPRDILVLTPDIETYAPFIQAVFDSPEDSSRRIPFSLADRSARCESQILNTFLAFLHLPVGRLGRTEVFTLLETEALRDKFSLTEAEMEFVRDWSDKAGIRWGADPQHRTSLQLPGFAENTWRSGLERMLLGFAMSGDGRQLFNETLPFDEIDSNDAIVLGRFVDFVEKIISTTTQLNQPRTLPEWETFLKQIVADFFELNDTSERQLEVIRLALEKLRTNSELAGFNDVVELAVIQEFLGHAFEENPFGSGFLNGGVTFAALKPMRSLPFKIICLVGMNDNVFPRPSSQLGFDLMAKKPRLGDRSSREDDRYLFFETLLSAREKLYLSYVGQSIRDNSTIPPSVVVSELLDYVTQGFRFETGVEPAKHLIITHRLQAFSAGYFRGERLFSYSNENLRASESLQARNAERIPFFTKPLAAPEENWRTISLDDLAAFFCNPCEFLLTRRVGLRLPQLEEQTEDREPFSINALDRYFLKQELVKAQLTGVDANALQRAIKASARLPVGEIGDVTYESLHGEAQEFVKRLSPLVPEEFVAPVDVNLTIGKFHLTGRIDCITERGLIRYRCSKVKAADLIRLWIPHLAWSALRPKGHCYQTIYVGSDETLLFQPVENAKALLGDLLVLYWRGLSLPLKFFPQTSLAFVETQKAKEERGGKANPIEAALKKWNGDEYNRIRGDAENPYNSLCFGTESPLDEDFQQTAIAIFGPILAYGGAMP